VSGGSALGFVPEGMADGFRFEALIPDYTVAGLPDIAGYILSAVAGAAILTIVFKIISSMKREKVGSNLE